MGRLPLVLLLALVLASAAAAAAAATAGLGEILREEQEAEAERGGEKRCLTLFGQKGPGCSPPDLSQVIARGWWDCASACIAHLSTKGEMLAAHNEFETQQRSIIRDLNSIKRVLEASKATAVIQPAFEWAQSADLVFLNVKFSHRIDAPATLDVEVDSVSLTPQGLHLRASKDQKEFVLKIDLWSEIDAEASQYASASVGRMTFTLTKQTPASFWPQLLQPGADKKKLAHHTWWAKKEQYSDEVEELEEEYYAALLEQEEGKPTARRRGKEGGEEEEEEQEEETKEALKDKLKEGELGAAGEEL